MSAVEVVEPAGGMLHEAYLYRDDADFVRGVGGFVRDGLDRDEAVIVVEPLDRLVLLRDALGDDASAVRFVDMSEVGVNPARIIALWRTYADEYAQRGRTLRGVGEPAYVGRRPAELVECRLHELLLNVAFTDGAPWRLLCPYDAVRLPGDVVDAARHTHPVWGDGAAAERAGHYHDQAPGRAFGERLPEVPAGATRMTYGLAEVDALRRTVGGYAAEAGLPPAVVADLVLAGHELAANTVRYGGGSGVLSMWREPGAVVFQFDDAGRIADPLAGRTTPTVGQERGRGLYLVNQLCDLVQLRSSEKGTSVRITNWVS